MGYLNPSTMGEGLTETSLLPSLWVDRVRSFHRRFCDRVPGRVVSRLAPDRRQARWCPVVLSILGWRSLKESKANRVQACTRPSTGSLVAQGPLHPVLKIPEKTPNVLEDKGHTIVTRATATGAEDMAISPRPTGSGAPSKIQVVAAR